MSVSVRRSIDKAKHCGYVLSRSRSRLLMFARAGVVVFERDAGNSVLRCAVIGLGSFTRFADHVVQATPGREKITTG